MHSQKLKSNRKRRKSSPGQLYMAFSHIDDPWTAGNEPENQSVLDPVVSSSPCSLMIIFFQIPGCSSTKQINSKVCPTGLM